MKQKQTLGKALVHQQRKLDQQLRKSTKVEQPSLKSELERPTIEEYIHLAKLANKDFTAEKQRINTKTTEVLYGLDLFQNLQESTFQTLTIPRRPKWNHQMSAKDLDELENQSFLEWRRYIAQLEEQNVKLSITPFEKNLNVWRQLWRVIERSHIVLIILDARNPLFFASKDLETYIEEQNDKVHKQAIYILNKADFLTQEQRLIWGNYFRQQSQKYFFFSAKYEQQFLDLGQQRYNQFGKDFIEESPSYVYSSLELLKKIEKIRVEYNIENMTVGTIGFPNVGKSSVINSLNSKKKVAVAATPGKTKHFQTLILDEKITLCDCPGLVFPSFANSKAELVICGVIPIDHLTDFYSPVAIICDRIPWVIFKQVYRLHQDVNQQKVTTSQLLQIYSQQKRHLTGRGLPDEIKAARIVLKDYTNGKLLYVHHPPTLNNSLQEIQAFHVELENVNIDYESNAQQEEQKNIQIEQDQKLFKEEVEEDKVKQVKLTKQQKRELKFAQKRGENVEEVLTKMFPKHKEYHIK